MSLGSTVTSYSNNSHFVFVTNVIVSTILWLLYYRLWSACHELRNPLHAIMAMLEFLVEDATLTPEQASDLNILFLSASHMQRLVNDVLDLAKLREGSLKITAEPVCVCVAVCTSVNILCQ